MQSWRVWVKSSGIKKRTRSAYIFLICTMTPKQTARWQHITLRTHPKLYQRGISILRKMINVSFNSLPLLSVQGVDYSSFYSGFECKIKTTQECTLCISTRFPSAKLDVDYLMSNMLSAATIKIWDVHHFADLITTQCFQLETAWRGLGVVFWNQRQQTTNVNWWQN